MMKRALVLMYALLVYFVFVAIFAYAVGFVGDFGVPKTVDSGRATSLAAALAIDAGLLALFAVQHSVMARRSFKRHWVRIVSWPLERSTFVLAASAALALLFWQWRPIPNIVWQASGETASALTLLFWIGWGILLFSTFLVSHWELFGIAQAWSYCSGRRFQLPPFRTPSLYRVVRHPMYLGFVIAFWFTPIMTVGHMLFAVAATGYILVGIYFEERDLIEAFGDRYLEYRRNVPMLIPLVRRYRSRTLPVEATEAREE